MNKNINLPKEELAAQLKGSLIEFNKTFFPLLTGRDFIISNPIGRESHIITICRELVALFRGELEVPRLLINVPPGHFKSTLLSLFVGWCYAHYKDCNFLYISYSKPLAVKHTATIKQLLSLRHYQYLFDRKISSDSKAKEYFSLHEGGTVAAFGSGGAITGQDAGLPGQNRFTGAVIMDDMHKPDEVFSDTRRESVIDNYDNTITKRIRGQNVAMICIAQRLHEADICNYFIEGKDGYDWKKVILPSIDAAGNALFPENFPLEMLRKTEKFQPYVYAAQDQQDPQPAGGGIFKEDWFYILDRDPEILATFITADTAETDKDYNDATVFSFFGVYKISHGALDTDQLAIHCIDCLECRVDPADLEDTFDSFYTDCMRYPVQPLTVAIEKKSTGVTLGAVLKKRRGIVIKDIKRDRSSGSKITRFLGVQAYVKAGLVSFTEGQKHVKMCVEHMRKITTNDSHRHDDIADTFTDAIQIALIDKSIYKESQAQHKHSSVARISQEQLREKRNLRGARWRQTK